MWSTLDACVAQLDLLAVVERLERERRRPPIRAGNTARPSAARVRAPPGPMVGVDVRVDDVRVIAHLLLAAKLTYASTSSARGSTTAHLPSVPQPNRYAAQPVS